MTQDTNRQSQLEVAHVLFMDLVGQSRLPMEEQTRRLAQLQAILRSTPEFRRAESCNELIRLPTGDGIALVFSRDPAAPVQCALEVARALVAHPTIKLRMGIHSGPVYRMEDINANVNVSGGGINFAQRVMDCGEAGHILLSSTIAELLDQLGNWSEILHDIGEYEVKHGARIHLYNLYTTEVGSPRVPEKLRERALPESFRAQIRPSRDGDDPAALGTSRRVVLLYRRHAQPDERLMSLLETRLEADGHEVFVDRHLTVGVDWVREIERQIRSADSVITLLSADAVQSEMLECEVETAYDAAQRQGKPRILPIRVAFTDPLPERLSAILDPLEYTLWESPEDDERVVSEVAAAVQSPPPSRAVSTRGGLEPVGGAVPLESQFYVVRPTDEGFRAAIRRQDSIVLVKGARQMGKTSLLARGLQEARNDGARVVLTDFQKLNAPQFDSADAFFLALADTLADQLGLEVLPDDVWNTRRGPSVNFERYLRREALGKTTGPVVWGMDEADRLFTCSFASEVFGLFRSWHNERALDPYGPWSRLTLAIAYATEAHLFITDVNQSPFNVGTRLLLEDFTPEQVADLNGRYGSPIKDRASLERFHQLLGGHPYLVRRGLHEMVTRNWDMATFEAQAGQDEGIYGDHLRRILVLLVRDTELSEVTRGILLGRPCATAESFYRLRSAGVMAGDSAEDARPRCQLYAAYLERHLL